MTARTYDAIAALRVRIARCELSSLRHQVSEGFTRMTTVVHLIGDGLEGVGEDLIYETADQERFVRDGSRLPLVAAVIGEMTLAELSRRLGALGERDLFSAPFEDAMAPSYRRWAFESAGLDLALRQAGVPLAAAVARPVRPVEFVVSMGLGDPPTLRRITALLARYPRARLKLDARSSWDDALVRALRTHDVAALDLKGHYLGQSIYQPPDAALYARVLEAFPAAWIEDAADSPETRALLVSHRARLSWDAPLHSVADIAALPFGRPAAINIKPSRFGSLRELFDVYDYCRAHRIEMYGGGDFELGPARGQIQYLAALFHPDAANDVAPSAFNLEPLPDGLPDRTLTISPAPAGFDLA